MTTDQRVLEAVRALLERLQLPTPETVHTLTITLKPRKDVWRASLSIETMEAEV